MIPTKKTDDRVVYFYPLRHSRSNVYPEFPNVRAWAAQGVEIVTLPLESGTESLETAVAILKKLQAEGTWFVIGEGEAASNALIAATRFSGTGAVRAVMLVDSIAEWPFPELSPAVQVGKLNEPLTIFATSKCLADAEILYHHAKNPAFAIRRYPENSDVETICAAWQWIRRTTP